MKITEVKINKLANAMNGTLGFASVTFEGSLVVRDLRIVEGQKGLFVSMPSKKGKGDEYFDTVFPITKELREHINTAVLSQF